MPQGPGLRPLRLLEPLPVTGSAAVIPRRPASQRSARACRRRLLPGWRGSIRGGSGCCWARAAGARNGSLGQSGSRPLCSTRRRYAACRRCPARSVSGRDGPVGRARSDRRFSGSGRDGPTPALGGRCRGGARCRVRRLVRRAADDAEYDEQRNDHGRRRDDSQRHGLRSAGPESPAARGQGT